MTSSEIQLDVFDVFSPIIHPPSIFFVELKHTCTGTALVNIHSSVMITPSRVLSLSTMAILSIRCVRGFSPRLTSRVARRSAFRSQTGTAIPCYQHNSRTGTPSTASSLTKLFSTQTEEDEIIETQVGVPMTLLAGFLGAGKTSTLQNLLTNNDGLKIGIIVNDVASINIDSKLLSNPNFSSAGTIELQNGCACCSLADELLTSVEQLMDGGNRELDAIVVELSGVADPVQVRANWEQAQAADHPATKLAYMDKIVTLVDASTFGTDWMTWDSSGDRDGWTDPADPCGADRKVPELLAEQVEAADILIINKIDLAGKEQVAIATALAKVLNDAAGIFETNFGEISVKEVLQAKKLDKKKEEDCNEPDCTDASHSHDHAAHDEACSEPACTDASHSHDHAAHEEACSEPACTDASHSHGHADHEEACSEPACTDTSHSHGHSDHEEACSEPACTDTSHSHGHSDHEEACSEPACTDTSHSHGHADHEEACSEPTCTDTSHSHGHADHEEA